MRFILLLFILFLWKPVFQLYFAISWSTTWSHYNMYMKHVETVGTAMRHHWAAASITKKGTSQLIYCLQMYRAPFIYFAWVPKSQNPPLAEAHLFVQLHEREQIRIQYQSKQEFPRKHPWATGETVLKGTAQTGQAIQYNARQRGESFVEWEK